MADEGNSVDPVDGGEEYPVTISRRDKLSVRDRSALMGRIKGSNTGPEILIFRLLRARKVYFARHVSSLPGKPDVVFRRCRLAVFIDGEFWHGKDFDTWKEGLSPFWRTKIEKNIERDRRVDSDLQALGWMILRIWGRELQKYPEECICNVLRLRSERLSTIQPTSRK